MPLRVAIDMNLSPDWVPILTGTGVVAIHWSSVGSAAAKDWQVMDWCRDHCHAVLTHDLDFGTLLALTHARGPSMVQVRTQDPMPDHIGPQVLAAICQHGLALEIGALVVIDDARARIRILPL